jgi:3-oxoacyl-[acyl-carrier-protein] synthase II
MHQVVVTGIGIVSPLGTSVEEFCRRMFAAESGLVDIRNGFVGANFPVPAAGRVPDERLVAPAALQKLGRTQIMKSQIFAAMATEEALQSLPEDISVDAIAYGTTDGISFDLIKSSFREFDSATFDWDATRAEATLELMRDMVALNGNGYIADHNLFTINNACVSSNQAIGLALQRIRTGRWRRAIVGGVDARCTDENIMNFHMLGALSVADVPAAEASRPFSKSRCGFVRGEGAGALILESLEEAQARGAKILGKISGYAASSDAFRLTDGRTDAKAAIHAMAGAIADARLDAQQIDAVSAHGTSTQMNDRLETMALKQVFGPQAYRIPVVALKSQIGHATVAARALQAVATLRMLADQRLAPTINYKDADPECDLDYVPNQSRPAQLNAILSNSFGFGGQNACVVFERYVN